MVTICSTATAQHANGSSAAVMILGQYRSAVGGGTCLQGKCISHMKNVKQAFVQVHCDLPKCGTVPNHVGGVLSCFALIALLTSMSGAAFSEVHCPTPRTSDRTLDRDERVWFGTSALSVLLPSSGEWMGMGPDRNYGDKLWWRSANFTAKSGEAPDLVVTAWMLGRPETKFKLSDVTSGYNRFGWDAILVSAHFPEPGCWVLEGVFQGTYRLTVATMVASGTSATKRAYGPRC